MLANLMMVVGLAITLYFACTDLPHPSERRYIADWSRLPLYFGTTIYAFEGIGLVKYYINHYFYAEYYINYILILYLCNDIVLYLRYYR